MRLIYASSEMKQVASGNRFPPRAPIRHPSRPSLNGNLEPDSELPNQSPGSGSNADCV